MNWRDLPPVTALRAFAAFADQGSVQKAGAVLNVSHAAISQQLRQLEAHLGIALFDRSGRAMELTANGRQLAAACQNGFGQMAEAAHAITHEEQERPLHVATTPMFASGWLMPRLSGFHTAYPGTGLVISTTAEVQQLEAGGIDVALRHGRGDWPGTVSVPLVMSPMVIVAAKSLVGEATYNSAADMAHLPWLWDIGVTESSQWMMGVGISESMPGGVTKVPGNLLLDGVRDGQGVAVMVRAYVERDIAAGRMRVLFQDDGLAGYHIVTRPGVQRPMVKTFVKWLRSEGAKDAA